MKAVFGSSLPSPSWATLDPTDRLRAVMFWRFNGGPDDFPSIDDLLATVKRFHVVDPSQAPAKVLGAWWQIEDAGLFFPPGSGDFVGEAIQHGFVCRDLELWTALAEAEDQPGYISWGVDAQSDPRLWIDPPKAEDLLRAFAEKLPS